MESVEREYRALLKGMLDIGEAMLKSGAEVSRVEDSMYRMCKSYGFVHANVWVIYSNIQATVETEEGHIFTQIRHIANAGENFDQLDYLNNLSRKVCSQKPDSTRLREMLDEVLNRKGQPTWLIYLAGIMGGAGFGVFFNCDLQDTIIAIIASALIVFLGRRLDKFESNPLVRNFLISLAVELFILAAVYFNLGHHYGYITLGVIMLQISGLGFTNGINDLLHRDTLAGILNIANSVLGASGIAVGIAAALLLFRGVM